MATVLASMPPTQAGLSRLRPPWLACLEPDGRTVRAMSWSPPSSLMHTRPWRSSPLAGPGFSTLPPIISESSEESHEADFDALRSSREFGHTQRSPSSASIVSDSLPPSTSGYGSRNASASASALLLADGEASTSSISLYPNSSANGSSHGHGSSQTHSHRPARLIKSPGRRPSSAQANLAPRNLSETSITPPPRARTVSHGHSRSISLPFHPVSPSPTIPQTYSPTSSRPTSPESQTTSKPPPSISRDPASNWMSASPSPSLFGQRMTPRFSRLTMASPAVVMPLSAKEYRMQKARDSLGNGKGKEKDPPTSSNHVTFTDNAVSAVQTPNGVPLLKISPPPSEHVHQPSSSSHHGPHPRPQPQPQVDHQLPRPLLHPSISTQSQSQSQSPPTSPRYKRSRSRPITPPRSSPLTSHPPISPKSSTGTFFSLASSSSSSSDDDTTSPPPSHPHGTDDPNAANAIPPARLRPRSRSRSYPDRLSNGARLSLLEAMNHLSQESTPLHRLSSHSQTDGANRLSMVSQTSGHTLFYDVESDGEGQERDGGGGQQRTSVLRTKSLEDFSMHASTGIEVVHPDGGDPGTPLDDERKGERNMRVVRISDTVEVSPAPAPRRRKLTKLRPGLACGPPSGPAPGTGTALETIQETKVQTQTHERRVSLLPWKSKGSGDPSKGGTVTAHSEVTSAGVDEKCGEDGHPSTLTNGVVHPNETTAPTPVPVPVHSRSPTPNGSARVESPSKLKSNTPTKKSSSDTPPSTSTSTPSTTPRKARRFTFSFLPSPNFHRPKREKSNTIPVGTDPGVDQHDNTKGKPEESGVKGVENGTDSTSTSICTITQGSQSTLTPESPMLSGPTTLSLSGCSSAVPMLRRFNAQAMAAGVPAPSKWDGGGDSTPSLITDGSTATLSSVPRTLPSFVRLPGGEPFIPQPSGLKASLTDTSEEDVEGAHGKEERTRMARVCMHRRQDPRTLALETSEEDDQMQLYMRSSSGVSIGAGLSPSPRPSTPSSMLTTATETSGSYMSFGTIPASTTSSSSTSRSASPSLMMGDKRDRVVSVSVPLGSGGGDGDVYTCALCGQLVPRSISPPPSHFAAGEPDQAEIHPMFTVPLVTVPMSVISTAGTYPRRDASMGNDGRFIGRRKSERQLSVPVLAAVSVPPARSSHMHARVSGRYVPGPTGAAAAAPTALTTKSPPVSPSKVRRRRRPQTAPAGTGNATSKFIEDMRVTAVRERSVDGYVGVGAGVGGDRATKPKSGNAGRESKLKTAFKGLLKWNN